jgi:hypothetical protein
VLIDINELWVLRLKFLQIFQDASFALNIRSLSAGVSRKQIKVHCLDHLRAPEAMAFLQYFSHVF